MWGMPKQPGRSHNGDMSKPSNTLQDMKPVEGWDPSTNEQPNESFSEQVLPGFQRALRSRRSVRVFDGERLEEALMMDCLRDATLAPTSSNLQTYELVWVREAAKRERLADYCMAQSAATTAGELVVVLARGDLWRRNLDKLVGIMTDNGQKELPEAVDQYYRKLLPMVMATDAAGLRNLGRRLVFWWRGRKEAMVRSPINRADHRVFAQVQAALVAQTLMLSAAAHGLDSCPMGGMDAKRIGQLLDLPCGAEVVMVIALGRRKPEGVYGPRVRLAEEDLLKVV